MGAGSQKAPAYHFSNHAFQERLSSRSKIKNNGHSNSFRYEMNRIKHVLQSTCVYLFTTPWAVPLSSWLVFHIFRNSWAGTGQVFKMHILCHSRGGAKASKHVLETHFHRTCHHESLCRNLEKCTLGPKQDPASEHGSRNCSLQLIGI